MNKDKVIDLKKVKSVYEIVGCWFWQYGRLQKQYVWDNKSDDYPFILNKHTGETISGLRKIKKFVEVNNLVLERF